jgi:hypothetical protein
LKSITSVPRTGTEGTQSAGWFARNLQGRRVRFQVEAFGDQEVASVLIGCTVRSKTQRLPNSPQA